LRPACSIREWIGKKKSELPLSLRERKGRCSCGHFSLCSLKKEKKGQGVGQSILSRGRKKIRSERAAGDGVKGESPERVMGGSLVQKPYFIIGKEKRRLPYGNRAKGRLGPRRRIKAIRGGERRVCHGKSGSLQEGKRGFSAEGHRVGQEGGGGGGGLL